MQEHSPAIYEFEGFCLDAARRLLLGRHGETIAVPGKALETLLFLVQRAGKVVEKEQLLNTVWADTFVEENNLNQHISTLRKVFGELCNENRFIATIPGRGYKFVAEVREVSDHSQKEAEPNGTKHLLTEPKATLISRLDAGRYVLTGLVVLAIIVSAGLYLWKRNSAAARDDKTIGTLAVLPFKPLVAGDANEELQLGMADTLISKLSRDSDVIVRPLSTVRKFSLMNQDPVSAGSELSVEAVLDGTIQTADDRIRVSARLIRISDGRQLWADQFDERFTDIFTVQDSITQRVASAIKANIAKRSTAYTQNLAAYQLYIKGRYHILKITRPELERAISYFHAAIDTDPSYALAYVGLADSYRLLSLSGEMPPGEVLPKAKAAAQKAIDLDETLADAHAVLGFITFWYDWNWIEAENEFKHAIELSPNNADAHIFYANLLSNLGRHQEALAEAQKAVELDPLNLRTAALQAQFLLHAGKAADALAELQKTFEMDPNYWLAHLYTASAYIEKEMYPEAIDEANKARSLYESPRSASFLGFALARAGKTKEAMVELNGLLALSRKEYVSPYNIAMIYAGLGNADKAIDWLEKGIEVRDPRMTFLKVEPKWNSLRGDERFVSVMRQMAFAT